ncbi:MAG: hypothetical protein MN733_04990 [Nitrososphaera sp.]|nr:hypothetical protein [Nitrososphaera sp.]
MQAKMVKEVAAAYKPAQQELEGLSKPPDMQLRTAKRGAAKRGSTC